MFFLDEEEYQTRLSDKNVLDIYGYMTDPVYRALVDKFRKIREAHSLRVMNDMDGYNIHNTLTGQEFQRQLVQEDALIRE